MRLNEAQNQLSLLLNNQKSMHLATIDNSGNPHASTTPFTAFDSKFYIFISELSQHCKNLLAGSKLSILMVTDESQSEQIFARNRANWNVSYNRLDKKTDYYQQSLERMADKLGPTIQMLANLQDFHLFELIPKNGRLIIGFGKAFNLNGLTIDTTPIGS